MYQLYIALYMNIYIYNINGVPPTASQTARHCRLPYSTHCIYVRYRRTYGYGLYRRLWADAKNTLASPKHFAWNFRSSKRLKKKQAPSLFLVHLRYWLTKINEKHRTHRSRTFAKFQTSAKYKKKKQFYTRIGKYLFVCWMWNLKYTFT